ncbi:phenylalanine ammonia-lyase [Mycena crocata]|nr:phenylalanine ammonia-lyase [Mycena crocata]
MSHSHSAKGTSELLSRFVKQHLELESYKNGKAIQVDGHSLSISAVAAVGRYNATVTLNDSPAIKDRIAKSRSVIVDKVNENKSVYGVSTGFGGSADTRTGNTLALGNALLQHQKSGVLPSSTDPVFPLPLLDPLASTSMPESWVRGAILVRINSLIRGHSGVRWELIAKMVELLDANITPLVPLRGSISASGDLSPLSYVAGTLMGNPSVRVFEGPAAFGGRQIVSSVDALAKHNIVPIPLLAKEHLGILNGTAFSASVAGLALNDAVHLAMLAQVCTAMGTEVLLGERGNYDPFIHAVARPHPGQVEAASTIWDLLTGSKLAHTHGEEVTIDEDQGELRQDRYPLRTAPQFLGPQIEDILSALNTVTLECNSTTDNPLIDGEAGEIHHGGNFQAMAVTNAIEKTRLSLHHIGKLLFAQCVELVNPAMNRGLPPSLAATDPSHNYHGKGIDIAVAAYVAELGYLANPVSTHIQSAEMHNQAVNSLALISARATINSLEILSMLTSSYLYMLCQAYDLRALQADFRRAFGEIVHEELRANFGAHISSTDDIPLLNKVLSAMNKAVDQTTTMDAVPRMAKVADASTSLLVEFFMANQTSDLAMSVAALSALPKFRETVAARAAGKLVALREEYLLGGRGPAPASAWLGRTRPIYEFIRVTLGIRMHGTENLNVFKEGLGVQDVTVGQNVSLIHEAIRDGKMQGVVVGLFAA